MMANRATTGVGLLGPGDGEITCWRRGPIIERHGLAS
jgi:hypothetical protein